MPAPARAAALIAALDLQPHPEGGHFRELFRSPHAVQPDDGRASRAALTHIYYLLADGAFSRWHRVDSDEVWHFYEGAPLALFVMTPAGDVVEHRLGPAGDDAAPYAVVPAGAWQAARAASGEYTLVGCTVAPGFDFADFGFLDPRGDVAGRIRNARPDLAALL